MRKQHVSRMITSAIDKDGVAQRTARVILHTFVEFLQSKYDPIRVSDACVSRMEKAWRRTFPLGWRDFLDTRISEEKLMASASKGACNKAPERNGKCLEFFMLTGTALILTCWPNSTQYTWMFGSCNNRNMASYCAYLRPTFPAHQRIIDQLFGKTYYEFLARIRTNQLRPTLSDMLHPSQYCGVPGNTIFDAVTKVRNAIAYEELTHTALHTPNLHFRAAFDRISHT